MHLHKLKKVLTTFGTFSYYSDFATGGNLTDGWTGEGTGSWGAANSNGTKGRWTVKGTPRAGTIYYQAQDGSQGTLDYRVHEEKGNTY